MFYIKMNNIMLFLYQRNVALDEIGLIDDVFVISCCIKGVCFLKRERNGERSRSI